LIEVLPENRPTIEEILSLDVMKIAHDSVPSENWSKNHVNSKEMKEFDEFQKQIKKANRYEGYVNINNSGETSQTNQIERRMNPSLKNGEIIDNKYQVVKFDKKIIDGKIKSPGNGYCCDLFDNEKLYVFNLYLI